MFIGFKSHFQSCYHLFIGLACQKEKPKHKTAQSEIAYLSGFELKLELVCDQGDDPAIGGIAPGNGILCTSDSVQLVFFSLDADSAALFAVGPGKFLVLCLQDQAGNLHRHIIFAQCNHHKVGVVDPFPLA